MMSDTRKQHTVALVFVAIFVVAGKFLLSNAQLHHLLFLISPVQWAVQFFLNETPTFISGQGFFFSQNNFIIDRSCAGGNFLIISSAMYLFLLLPHKPHHFFRTIAAVFIVSYVLTFVANTSRILTILFVANNPLFAQIYASGWFHELAGGFVYLFFLIVSYLLVSSRLKHPVN